MTRPGAETGSLASDDRRYERLVDAITDYAIYMLDPAGDRDQLERRRRAVQGLRAAEIIGQHFSRFYTDEDRAAGAASSAPWHCARSEGRFEAEGWRVRKDGTRFWAHVVIDPIRDTGRRS